MSIGLSDKLWCKCDHCKTDIGYFGFSLICQGLDNDKDT